MNPLLQQMLSDRAAKEADRAQQFADAAREGRLPTRYAGTVDGRPQLEQLGQGIREAKGLLSNAAMPVGGAIANKSGWVDTKPRSIFSPSVFSKSQPKANVFCLISEEVDGHRRFLLGDGMNFHPIRTRSYLWWTTTTVSGFDSQQTYRVVERYVVSDIVQVVYEEPPPFVDLPAENIYTWGTTGLGSGARLAVLRDDFLLPGEIPRLVPDMFEMRFAFGHLDFDDPQLFVDPSFLRPNSTATGLGIEGQIVTFKQVLGIRFSDKFWRADRPYRIELSVSKSIPFVYLCSDLSGQLLKKNKSGFSVTQADSLDPLAHRYVPGLTRPPDPIPFDQDNITFVLNNNQEIVQAIGYDPDSITVSDFAESNVSITFQIYNVNNTALTPASTGRKNIKGLGRALGGNPILHAIRFEMP